MNDMMKQVQERAGKDDDFNHRFFLRVKDMLDAGDKDMIYKENIPIKLLRLNPACADGFIMTDFPQNIIEAEKLEQFKGGLNAFVHLSLPEEVLF